MDPGCRSKILREEVFRDEEDSEVVEMDEDRSYTTTETNHEILLKSARILALLVSISMM